MTAEIAVLNQFGVALAADSAVSIGDKKVYNSANKLFALSKTQPVGIMVFGNAKFMSAPWEVLIKHFRRNVLKTKQFPSLDGYYSLFLSFLANTTLIPKENEDDFVNTIVQHSLRQVIHLIEIAVKQHIEKQRKISKTMSISIANKEVDGWITREQTQLKKHPSKATREQLTAIRKNHLPAVRNEITKVLTPLGLGKQRISRISNAVVARLGCQGFSANKSGVVIAGYGEADLYPSAISCEISGRAGGFLRIVQGPKASVGLRQRAWVTPFAQREMVDTFIGGIDPDFQKAINSGVMRSFGRVTSEILPKLGIALTEEQTASIEKELQSESRNFTDGISSVQQKDFAQPVLSSVAALPIDELAAMAEALVSLTSFKRKVTMVPESVGGPVDVAVISKGDGFIWIKRKHYFRPELNQHYLDNFSRT